MKIICENDYCVYQEEENAGVTILKLAFWGFAEVVYDRSRTFHSKRKQRKTVKRIFKRKKPESYKGITCNRVADIL